MLTDGEKSCIVYFVLTKNCVCDSGSAGRVRPCQGRGRGFESRLALFLYTKGILKGYLLYINESCRTRTVRGLRSAPVGAEPTSTGCRAPSRAQTERS